MKQIFIYFLILSSCTKVNTSIGKTEKSDSFLVKEVSQMPDYSIYQGYKPKDGIIPDTQTAVKVAETLLVMQLWLLQK